MSLARSPGDRDRVSAVRWAGLGIAPCLKFFVSGNNGLDNVMLVGGGFAIVRFVFRVKKHLVDFYRDNGLLGGIVWKKTRGERLGVFS